MHSRILTKHRNSFKITIPQEYVNDLGLKEGQNLLIGIDIDRTSIIITKQFSGRKILVIDSNWMGKGPF